MLKRLIVAIFLSLIYCNYAESNDYYTHGSFPVTGSQATSAGMRAEFDAISAGFDKLPGVTGNANKLVVVNSSGSGMTTTSGTLTIPVGLTISGAYAATLSLTSTTNVTLPTSGTLATVAGTETLSNKTYANPVISGVTGIGGNGNLSYQVYLNGNFVPSSGGAGSALEIRTVLTGQVNQNESGLVVFPTLNEAASGTHPWFASVELNPPTIGNSGATVTNAATLRVAGAPTGGTNNYAIEVDEGSIVTKGGRMEINVVNAAGTNPYLKFNDGTSDSFIQVASGKFDLNNLSHVTFSPGLSEKARVTSDGIFQVGSVDTAGVMAGGATFEGAIRLTETSDPIAPATNHATLYARDDGSGNTVLAVQFPTGSPITIVRENVGVIPPGTVHFWAGGSAPSGWLLANGANVSRTTYALLFSAIGTTFGSGDGSTTFTLPTITNYTTNIKGMIKCKTKPVLPWKMVDQSLKQAA